MKLLFAYENPLPNAEADAEVFVTTSKYLAARFPGSRLHAPIAAGASREQVEALAGQELVPAMAPLRPAAAFSIAKNGSSAPWSIRDCSPRWSSMTPL